LEIKQLIVSCRYCTNNGIISCGFISEPLAKATINSLIFIESFF
jgi:hypothetical protein